MTVFCPNCGTKNTDEATNCVACGTELKSSGGGESSKFKGTMMMSGVQIPTPEEMAAEQGQPATPAPATPAPVPGGGGQPPSPNIAYQQTMALGPEGFSPPGGGPADAPPGAPAAPTQAGFGGPATPAPGGYQPPPAAPDAGFGTPQGGFGAPPSQASGFGAPPNQPSAPGFGGPAADAPPAKSGNNRTLLYAALGCFGLISLCCLGGAGFYAYTYYAATSALEDYAEAIEEAETAREDAAAAVEPEEASATGGGSVCDRAAACCEAYVGVMTELNPAAGNVEQTCGAVRSYQNLQGMDNACNQLVVTWRNALTQMNRDVPAACAE